MAEFMQSGGELGILMLQPGDDPALGYCRVCGAWSKPTYEGPYQYGVCSMTCYEEFKWRETLRNMRKPYRVKETRWPCGCRPVGGVGDPGCEECTEPGLRR